MDVRLSPPFFLLLLLTDPLVSDALDSWKGTLFSPLLPPSLLVCVIAQKEKKNLPAEKKEAVSGPTYSAGAPRSEH